MKKLHTLLSAALLCLVALAVSAGQRAAAAADWEVATSLTIDEVVLITNAESQKELDGIQLYGATRAGRSADYKGVPNGAFPLIVVEGSQEGTFAFMTPDGKYLAWDFATANSLNTSDVLNANSSWRVTFEDGKAVIRNVDNGTHLLQYNADMNRFAAYTTRRLPSHCGTIRLRPSPSLLRAATSQRHWPRPASTRTWATSSST